MPGMVTVTSQGVSDVSGTDECIVAGFGVVVVDFF